MSPVQLLPALQLLVADSPPSPRKARGRQRGDSEQNHRDGTDKFAIGGFIGREVNDPPLDRNNPAARTQIFPRRQGVKCNRLEASFGVAGAGTIVFA